MQRSNICDSNIASDCTSSLLKVFQGRTGRARLSAHLLQPVCPAGGQMLRRSLTMIQLWLSQLLPFATTPRLALMVGSVAFAFLLGCGGGGGNPGSSPSPTP